MMEATEIEQTTTEKPTVNFRYFPFFNQKQPVFVLVLAGFIFYCTSLFNEYALDDGIVIHQNNSVLKGVAGIKDILTTDLYDSFYRRMNAKDQLQGGRYRPLPVISFAIEQQITGTYRSGYYLFVQDINQNGILDPEAVDPVDLKYGADQCGTGIGVNKTRSNDSLALTVVPPLNRYEYNDFVDLNGDGTAQENECYNCWDENHNFKNDFSEDLNADGVFNEVDCQVKGAFLRHFNNMLAYIVACVLLYLLFRRHLFKDNHDMAFLASLIFLAHPLHTENVANVKGRDEIFSVIFIALTFLFSFQYMENKKTGTLVMAAVMFLLALLSKEYGMVLILLIPMGMHVFNKTKINYKSTGMLLFCFLLAFVLMVMVKLRLAPAIPGFVLIFSGILVFLSVVMLAFRRSLALRQLETLMIGLFAAALLYTGLRLNAVSIAPGIPDTEILNNPYLLANGEEKFATKVFILIKYIGLVFLPVPLCSDYSYDTIAYRHFGDWDFILSLVLNAGLLILGIVLLIKRHMIGFAIAVYYLFLVLVSNFIFDVGAIMHEGFLFHASIGVAIIFAWLIITGFEKMQALSFVLRRSLLFGSLSLLLFLYGCKTWERNWDWKNDVTLFLKDVNTNPNSVLILGNAGARWIDLADTKEITGITLAGENPKSFNDYNGTLKITDEELRLSGFKTKREVALNKGMRFLKHAIELHPKYVNGYLNLGLASFKLNKDRDAVYYWKIAEHLYPDNPYLANYYRVYSSILAERGAKAFDSGKLREAQTAFQLWTIVQPKNVEAWFNLGGSYFNQEKDDLARRSWEKALKLNPGDVEIIKALEKIGRPD